MSLKWITSTTEVLPGRVIVPSAVETHARSSPIRSLLLLSISESTHTRASAHSVREGHHERKRDDRKSS